MPRDMLRDAASLSHGTDTGKARVIMRNGEYPAVTAQPTVFADYAVGNVKQADVGHHARFLAVECLSTRVRRNRCGYSLP